MKTVESNKDLKLRSFVQYIESVQLHIDCTPHATLKPKYTFKSSKTYKHQKSVNSTVSRKLLESKDINLVKIQ